MARAKQGDRVKVHYVCILEDGTIVGSTMNQEPLQFTIGSGQVILGLEEIVIGMKLGETKADRVINEKAFGPRREEMVSVVDRKKLPMDLQVEVGMQLQAMRGDGQVTITTVTNVSEYDVTLDFNHPFAGKDLIFNINLVEIV
jgi:peptidylprolyl isomerase